MYILDVNDVMLFLKNLHQPHDGFDIKNFVKFASGHSYYKQDHLITLLVTSILTGFLASGMPFSLSTTTRTNLTG